MTNTPSPSLPAADVGASLRPQSSRLARLPYVEQLTGLRKSTLYAKMREGTFPKSVRLSARAVAWRESEVIAWCEARTSEGGGGDQ